MAKETNLGVMVVVFIVGIALGAGLNGGGFVGNVGHDLNYSDPLPPPSPTDSYAVAPDPVPVPSPTDSGSSYPSSDPLPPPSPTDSYAVAPDPLPVPSPTDSGSSYPSSNNIPDPDPVPAGDSSTTQSDGPQLCPEGTYEVRRHGRIDQCFSGLASLQRYVEDEAPRLRFCDGADADVNLGYELYWMYQKAGGTDKQGDICAKRPYCGDGVCGAGEERVEVPCSDNGYAGFVTGFVTHPATCKCYKCQKESCNDVFGANNWDACPADKGGKAPFCCAKSADCNQLNPRASAACCPEGSTSTFTLFAGGVNYCVKSDNFCKEKFGKTFIGCTGDCCDTRTEECKSSLWGVKRCVALKGCKGTKAAECGKHESKSICCFSQSECIKIKGKPVCAPKASSCKNGEIHCPGQFAPYDKTTVCCPVGSKCFAHPDGAPYCV